jgi:hypothetical protein
MARLVALLGPLATLVLRELRRTASVAGNHFLLFAVLLFALNPRSVVFLVMVAGLVILFPLSADPLRKIPKDRLLLLPLSTSERVRVRILSFFFSPIVWLILVVPIWGGKQFVGVSFALVLLALTANGISLLWSRDIDRSRRFNPLGWFPDFPGTLGGLVKKNIREMLHVLDPYVGMALAAAATIYRFTTPKPVPEAMHGMTMLVALTLSTYAQRLFALDSGNGFERYGLMPIRGWQVLVAKDLAFLLVLLILVLPLTPLSGLAAGLVLLAFGHRPSVLDPQSQSRWCFVIGARGWSGLVQVLAMFAAGMVTFRLSPLALLPCVFVYLVSLFHYGARFECRWTGTMIYRV